MKSIQRHVSKERKQAEKELLNYLRNWRFFKSRFEHIEDLEVIINDIVEYLKSDV